MNADLINGVYATFEERTAREDNRTACIVYISGATDVNADLINNRRVRRALLR